MISAGWLKEVVWGINVLLRTMREEGGRGPPGISGLAFVGEDGEGIVWGAEGAEIIVFGTWAGRLFGLLMSLPLPKLLL